VLFARGKDLRALPLRARKAVFKRLLGGRHDLIVMDGEMGKLEVFSNR
jgi:hypothetical protein